MPRKPNPDRQPGRKTPTKFNAGTPQEPPYVKADPAAHECWQFLERELTAAKMVCVLDEPNWVRYCLLHSLWIRKLQAGEVPPGTVGNQLTQIGSKLGLDEDGRIKRGFKATVEVKPLDLKPIE